MLLILTFALGSMLGFFDARASQPQKYINVEVHSGDTLWAIAKTYGNTNQDIRNTIYDICKLNEVSASTLQPGMVLLIPVED